MKFKLVSFHGVGLHKHLHNMSDIPPRPTVLEWKLSIQSPSLAYAAQANSRTILFAVDIPYPLLKCWYDYITNKVWPEYEEVSRQNKQSNESFQPFLDFDYVDFFELAIPGSVFGIRKEKTVREEVNNRLRRLASDVKCAYAKTKSGRKRKDMDQRVKRFHVLDGMALSVEDLQNEKENTDSELLKWKESYNNLKAEKEKLYAEMLNALNKKDDEIQELSEANKDLRKYIESLEKKENSMEYKGKDVAHATNKTRTLKCFLSRAKIALWLWIHLD